MSEPRLSPPDGPTLEEERAREAAIEELRGFFKDCLSDAAHQWAMIDRATIAREMKECAIVELIRIHSGVVK